MIKIATVINYCTTDYRFLKFCIDEAKKFSHQIVIPVCSHFFNGESENRALLNLSYQEHLDVLAMQPALSCKYERANHATA